MNLNIYPVRMNNSYMNVRKESEPQKPVENAPAFQGNIRKPLLALVAGTLIGAGAISCTNNNKAQQDTFEPVENVDPIQPEQADYSSHVKSMADTIGVGTKKYPDGTEINVKLAYNSPQTKEKCYEIEIKRPNGERTERDEHVYPRGLENYRETTYWSNGKIKEKKEYTLSFDGVANALYDQKYYEKYNEKGQLLYWQDTFLSEHDGGEEKSDKLGRLKVGADGTEYFYKGDSEEAYKTVETKDGCQLVTIYGEGGAFAYPDNILEEYFIAKDGTKTDASVLNEIKW